jgi:hypothetical protein
MAIDQRGSRRIVAGASLRWDSERWKPQACLRQSETLPGGSIQEASLADGANLH